MFTIFYEGRTNIRNEEYKCMNQELLNQLKQITTEEAKILSGNTTIEKSIYMQKESNIIDAKKLLDTGKLIEVRTHTRFVHFPEHKHNYIEVIYMCSGETHHIINGIPVDLKQGELLFLNQNATQEIFPAKENDVAVNFIILPEFFDYALQMIGEKENLFRNFVLESLTGEDGGDGYLHFKVENILPIQNLVENLIWTIRNKQPNRRSIHKATMGLLLLQLLNYMDHLEMKSQSKQQRLMLEVFSYVEEHYRDGELSKLAQKLHYDLYWISKEIKKNSGKTYTELVQEKRLNQAAYLLKTTNMSVLDIAVTVGYENISYFHRIFQQKYELTPRKFRVSNRI